MTGALVSWSGGKDSYLALHRAVAAGVAPRALLTMMIEDGRRSRSHGLAREILEAQAAALGLELVTAAASWDDYEGTFVRELLRLRERGLERAVFGDIDGEPNRAWVVDVCAAAGVEPLHPLWLARREELVEELVDLGVDALVMAVRDGVLPRELLGRRLDGLLLAELGRTGVDLCGELGEYHTVVVDAPLFGGPIEVEPGRVVLRDGVVFLDLGLVAGRVPDASYTRPMAASPTAVILTVGNEIVSGDVENTNASWISRRLAGLGVHVRLLAAVRDELDEIGDFLRAEAQRTSHVFVTGGLGGTPDDITREAVAAAFDVPLLEIPDLAARLRSRFDGRGLGDYAARWAGLPKGAEPLENPLGGAPGFRLANVYVFPGLPSEMEAMFDSVAERFRGLPIGAWRRAYRTGEGQIVRVLEEATRLHPHVSVGSYPRFLDDGPETEVVLKSADAAALEEAGAWLEAALEAAIPAPAPPRR